MTTAQLLESSLAVLYDFCRQIGKLCKLWQTIQIDCYSIFIGKGRDYRKYSMRRAGFWLRLTPSIARMRNKHANCKRYILMLRKVGELLAPTVLITWVCIRRNHIYARPYIELPLKSNRPAWCTTGRQCLKIHSTKFWSLIVYSDGTGR
jgi:hypothetical protein